MNKVIFSSFSLQKYLREIVFDLGDGIDYVSVKCINDSFSINESIKSLNVTNSGNFEIYIVGDSLQRLYALLKVIQEQPITMTFKDNDYIQIDGIVV